MLLLLLLSYPFVDNVFGTHIIAGVAFVLLLVILLLCLLTPRTLRQRWMPFLIGFVIFLAHGFFDHL